MEADDSEINSEIERDDAEIPQVLDPIRRFTDGWYLLLAVLVIAGIASIAAFAGLQQQASIVNHGQDWRGHKCGHGDLSHAPLKMWINPLFENVDAGAVCLETCPETTNGAPVAYLGTVMCVCNEKLHSDAANPLTPLGALCQSDAAKLAGFAVTDTYELADMQSYVTYTDATPMRPCVFQHQTKKLMNMCLPSLDDIHREMIVLQRCGPAGDQPCGLQDHLPSHLNSRRFVVQRLFRDVTECRLVILACCTCAILFAGACFWILERSAGTQIMLWTNLLWLACMLASFCQSSQYFADRAAIVPTLATKDSDRLSSNLLVGLAWLSGVAIVLQLLTSLFFTCKGFQRSVLVDPAEAMDPHDAPEDKQKGKMNIAEIAAKTFCIAGGGLTACRGSDAGACCKFPLVWSIVAQVFFTLALLSGWFWILFYVVASGEVSVDSDGVSHFTFDAVLHWSLVFHCLAWLWLVELIDVVVRMVAGGGFVTFGFAPTDEEHENGEIRRMPPGNPVWNSFVIMFTYHTGTMVALATWLLLLRPVRAIESWIHFVWFGAGVPTSRWDTLEPNTATCSGKFELCYISCIRRLLRGSDKQTVMQTVLHGSDYRQAHMGTAELDRDYGKFMTLPIASTDTVLFITRNNIALSCCFLGHLLIMCEAFGVQENDIQSTLSALLVIFLFGHVIGWAVLCHLDAVVVAQMVGYEEAVLRHYSPGVPQLTVPGDIDELCRECQSHADQLEADQDIYDSDEAQHLLQNRNLSKAEHISPEESPRGSIGAV